MTCLIALTLAGRSSHAFAQDIPTPPLAAHTTAEFSVAPRPTSNRSFADERWIEDKVEMTRLDSILSFGSRSKALGDRSRGIALEQYAGDYPNSPALQLAIGRAFLYNSIYYERSPKNASSCSDTINYDFSDSAFHWLSLAHSDKAVRDPEYHLTSSAWLAQAYAALILDKIRAHDAPTVRRLLINAMLDSVIDPFSLDYATDLLAETPKDAILFVGQTGCGSNVLLPLWYLQAVERQRTDISIVHSFFLADAVHRSVVRSGLEGITRGIQFASHTSAPTIAPDDSRLYAPVTIMLTFCSTGK